MKHIRYMTTNETVCEKPGRLGRDFVVNEVGPYDEPSCGVCYSLLASHNQHEYEKEGLLSISHTHRPLEEPSIPALGIFYGVLMGSAFWITFFIIFWVVFIRG